MIVTEIVELATSKTRAKVYIDQEFAFVLYKGELRKYGLKKGQEIPEETYRELWEKVLPKRAKLRCMNLLESKDYTAEQLRTKLRQGDYPEEIIESAVEEMIHLRYVDDLRYAVYFIDSHHESRSRRRMDNDLRTRGVHPDTIQSAWQQWEDSGNEQDEETQIRKLLEKKHFDKETADRKEVQRMYGFLSRRGFNSELISRVLFK